MQSRVMLRMIVLVVIGVGVAFGGWWLIADDENEIVAAQGRSDLIPEGVIEAVVGEEPAYCAAAAWLGGDAEDEGPPLVERLDWIVIADPVIAPVRDPRLDQLHAESQEFWQSVSGGDAASPVLRAAEDYRLWEVVSGAAQPLRLAENEAARLGIEIPPFEESLLLLRPDQVARLVAEGWLPEVSGPGDGGVVSVDGRSVGVDGPALVVGLNAGSMDPPLRVAMAAYFSPAGTTDLFLLDPCGALGWVPESLAPGEPSPDRRPPLGFDVLAGELAAIDDAVPAVVEPEPVEPDVPWAQRPPEGRSYFDDDVPARVAEALITVPVLFRLPEQLRSEDVALCFDSDEAHAGCTIAWQPGVRDDEQIYLLSVPRDGAVSVSVHSFVDGSLDRETGATGIAVLEGADLVARGVTDADRVELVVELRRPARPISTSELVDRFDGAALARFEIPAGR